MAFALVAASQGRVALVNLALQLSQSALSLLPLEALMHLERLNVGCKIIK